MPLTAACHSQERALPMPSVQSAQGYQVMWEVYKVRSRWRADGGPIDPKAAGPAYALPSALLAGLSWGDVRAPRNRGGAPTLCDRGGTPI